MPTKHQSKPHESHSSHKSQNDSHSKQDNHPSADEKIQSLMKELSSVFDKHGITPPANLELEIRNLMISTPHQAVAPGVTPHQS